MSNANNYDERMRLVKTFAYEYVRFNHDPNNTYLVTDVTDDCMLELEGLAGLFAPHLFQRCNAQAQPITTTPPNFTEQCDKCGCEYVQVGKVFTVNLDCDCDCHKRPTTTDFTERARQLVASVFDEDWEALEQRIASALAEAATQGRSENDYVAWCRYTHEGVDESGADIGTIVTCDSDAKGAFKVYRASSPDSSYLDRVRNEAATAATEFFCYWLARIYEAGHRDTSYEEGETLNEALRNINQVLGFAGYEPGDGSRETLLKKGFGWRLETKDGDNTD